MTKHHAATLAALCLAACGPSTIDPGGIEGPRPALMVPPVPLPATPAGAEANPIMHRHAAEIRGVCVDRGRQVRGLQSYARLVSRAKGTP